MRTARLVDLASNPETNRWQIHLSQGGWSTLKAESGMKTTNSPTSPTIKSESCILVVDAASGAMVSMREW
jgi:hypothetical protein